MIEWKDIKEYEGLYQVSNYGNVKSIGYGKEKILKPGKHKNGYLYVILCKDGKRKTFRVHRLVAENLIPNPLNFPQVNHKDENKENNHLDNLEWCDAKYNNNYGTHNEKIAKSLSKTIYQYTKGGGFVKEWNSTREIEYELGFSHGNICQCCLGKFKSMYGFKWSYNPPQVSLNKYFEEKLF